MRAARALGTIVLLLIVGSIFIGGSRGATDVGCQGAQVRVHADLFMVYQYEPDLAVGPDGTIYSVWIDNRQLGGASSVYFAKSTDGGTTWTDPSVRVSPLGPEGRGGGVEPDIALDGSGTLYVAYRGGFGNTIDVWVTTSKDGGFTWGTPSRVNDVSGWVQISQSYGPAIALASDGVAYVAWEDWRNGDSDIYAARSTDGGATWGTSVRVNDDAAGIEQRGDPAVAVDAWGTVYVAWQDRRNDPQDADVFIASSQDGGLSWSPNFAMNDVAGGWQGDPALAADGAGVYAAWADVREGGPSGDIYFSRSTNGGLSWSANVRLNEQGENGQGTRPTMAVGPTGLYVSWAHAKPNVGWPDVLLIQSLDGGATWGPNVWVTQIDRSQLDPAIALGGEGQVYVAWVDERNNYVDPDSGGETGNPDIYFTVCQAQGLPELQGAIRQIIVNPITVSLGDGSPPVSGDRSPDPGDDPACPTAAMPSGRRGCRPPDEETSPTVQQGTPVVETRQDPWTAKTIAPLPTAQSSGCRGAGVLSLAALGLVLGVGVWERRLRLRR